MQGKLKRYFEYSAQERQDIFLVAFIGSLVLFMFVWRTTSFSFATGIPQFLLMLLSSFFGLGIFLSSIKLLAIRYNYTAHYTKWTTGLLISFVLGFLSYGFLPVLFTGSIDLKRNTRLSHGERYLLENKSDIFLILVGGIWISMVSGIVFQALYSASEILIFYYLMVVMALISIFSVLPFAQSIGSHIFYANRRKYYFVSIAALVFGIFLLLNSPYALLFGLLAAAILGLFALKNPLEKHK